MNIFLVRDSYPDLVSNTRYFWIDEDGKIDGDTTDMSIALLVSNDWKFASHKGKSYRVCQIEIDDDDERPFIKVWEKDPFTDYLPDYMQPMPLDDQPEYSI